MGWPDGQDASHRDGMLREARDSVLAARQIGNRRQEILALTDLGLALLHEGDASRAVRVLQWAWQLAQQVGDMPLETDVVINLGRAFLQDNQPGCGMRLLEQSLARVRAAADRFQELLVLGHLGDGHAQQGDPAGAVLFYEQALALAVALGSRRQQADLRWHLAIQKAEMGMPAEACQWAQAAIEMKEEIGDPQAAWLAHNLKQFRESAVANAAEALAGRKVPSSSIVGGWAPVDPALSTEDANQGPGLLRMAIAATKAMATFLGSGLKTSTAEVRRQRLDLCADCEHHTGLRCRICGCFTKVKAMMPHERCPLGKWLASGEVEANSSMTQTGP